MFEQIGRKLFCLKMVLERECLLYFITATMNKNPRGSYDATKGHRNNINIQINFNVKDKNQGFTGKKIDNYVEVEHKNTSKTDNATRLVEEPKKNKKKQSEPSQKNQKEKPFDTPIKQRYHDISRIPKNNTSKTPEKKEQSRREERSRSTNQKLVKKKNAKSMENIKAGIKITKNKANSPQSSAEKSRSRSKSNKKMLRSNEQSAKKLHVFSNSGIKNKITNPKLSKSRQRQMSGIIKKQNHEEEHERIKKFMEEKKKKQRLEKSRHSKEDKIRRDKIQSQLKKVEIERKANASKPVSISKKMFAETKERLPIYCFDDEFDQSGDYDRLQEQASNLIHESPPRQNLLEGVPLDKHKDLEKANLSSDKKAYKKKRRQLVYRYLNGSITSKQLQDLNKAVVTIQRWWRGCLGRRQFVKRLNDQSVRNRYIKNRIQNKRSNFWHSDQDNSIVNIERDSTIKINQSGSESLNYLNFNSKNRSDISQQEPPTFDQKNRTDRFKNLALHLDEEEEEQVSKDRSQKSEKQTNQNSKMLKEIEELRKMLEKQTEKYRSLEEENQSLKQNIKILSLKESRQIKEENGSELITSKDFFQIRMPKKIENPSNQLKIEGLSEQSTKPKESDLENQREVLSQEDSSKFDLSQYKKQFQAFECSSPSNSRLEQQLKKLKSKNIENIFLKKELKIQQQYQKKSSIFDKMFQDRLFSPRTYNFKKKELQEKLKVQKEQIKQKIQEAKEVIGFIDDISSDESDQEGSRQNVEGAQACFSVQRNFKKEKGQIYIDNTSQNNQQQEMPEQEEKDCLIPDNKSHSSYSSQDDKIYKKYWTDDIEEVHKHTLEITKKIEEALKASSQEQSSNNRQEEANRQYFSTEGYHSYSSSKEPQLLTSEKQIGHQHSKSSDFDADSSEINTAYKDYLQDCRELVTDPEKKARQIFNKIDLSEQIESKSDEQMQNSHDNICKLLNQRPLQVSPSTHQKKQQGNLIISEAQFNNKKRKEQQLSRSSSFEKSNKSLSINNNSQVQARGFITNLTFIKEFCISVCEYIRSNEHYKEDFIEKLVKATKLDTLELLRSYRVTINGEVKNNYNTFQDQYVYPYFKIITSKEHTISHELFNDFMKVYEEEKQNNPALTQPSMSKTIKEMREYFLISIIDNFNQSLQYQKPGSIYGLPLPWLHHSKHLKNYPVINLKNANISTEKKYYSGSSDEEQNQEQKKLDLIFGASIAKIIQWGSCLCGFIADPMPMEMGDSQIANLSDDQLMSIRENRVGLMLEKWLIEQEQEMTNSTSEYTEVLLFLSEKIIEGLFVQCSDELGELLGNN